MSGLRQAALLTCAFLVVLVLTGGAGGALFELQREFTRRMQVELEARFDRIAAEIDAGGSFDPVNYPVTSLEIVRLTDAGRNGFFEEIEPRVMIGSTTTAMMIARVKMTTPPSATFVVFINGCFLVARSRAAIWWSAATSAVVTSSRKLPLKHSCWWDFCRPARRWL